MEALNLYGQYVGREPNNVLINGLGDTVNNEEAKARGWNTYYKAHGTFLDTVWNNQNTNKDTFTNWIKSGLEETTNFAYSVGGVNVYTKKTVIKRDTPQGRWLYETIKDLPGNDIAAGLENFATLSTERQNELVNHAAKRRMAFDWHNGTGNLPGNPPGKDRGLATYSELEMLGTDGNITKHSAVLTSDGSSFVNEDSYNKAANAYGQFHWNNYGKNEARALPGNKFQIKDGKLTYDKEFVGTGLQQNYDNIAKSFNDAESGPEVFKNLVEGAIKALPANYIDDIARLDSQGNLDGDAELFSGFYLQNKITPVNASDLAQPPSYKIDGKGFDPEYYKTTTYGAAALNDWSSSLTGVDLGRGLTLPDLDKVGPYGGGANTDANINLYLQGVYTDRKNSGYSDANNRGNAAEAAENAEKYAEGWNELSDGEREAYRDDYLGLTGTSSGSGRPTIEWNEPFEKDADGNIIYEVDEFGNRTPKLNANGVSVLEGSIFNIFGKKDLEEQDKFKALALDLLETSVAKLDAEKKRERELNMYKGLPGFNEIYGANASLANSLIGDSGIGGYLSMAGVNVDAMTESLEDSLSNVTGISNNSSVFNWQKWFDETLLERYENMEEITGKLKADIENLDPILDETEWLTFQQSIENTNRGEDGALTEEWKALMKANNLPIGTNRQDALNIKSPFTWQALLDKYDLDSDLNKQEAAELLSGADSEINKIYTIEDEFKELFIEDYIKPRFDQSKSMDEFISYLDTLDEDEQNVFQTQDAMMALKNTASAYASAKLEQIKGIGTRSFDADFYFDPTVAIDPNITGIKDDDYRRQAEVVQADYAAANANGNAVIEGTVSDYNPQGLTWNDYAYHYGKNLSDKKQFAELHYEIIGRGLRQDADGKPIFYDPAQDVTSVADIENYIANEVIPAVNQAQLDLDGAVFSSFTTPEEFADAVLKGIDPSENNPEWKEVLEQFGMEVDASLEEVKDYIIDITRTGAAQEIRETIKFLNEKKLTPTQERIGVSYIEREEDANPTDPEGQTALFQIFSDAGYSGTQDEFFAEFMPDADRGDIEFITQGMAGGGGFSLESISDDPFTALSQVGSFFGESDDVFNTGGYKSEDKEDSNYFTLFDEPEDSYSDAGRDYIKEYTSFFSS